MNKMVRYKWLLHYGCLYFLVIHKEYKTDMGKCKGQMLQRLRDFSKIHVSLPGYSVPHVRIC